MSEFFASSSFFGILLTLAAYIIAMAIKKRFKASFLNPLLIAIVLCVGVILLLHVDYDVYNASAKYLSFLLTPATITLAIPLYEQIDKLKANLPAIMIGVLSGVLTSSLTIFLLSKLFSFSKAEFVTFFPKSITTAIGLSVCEEFGGFVSISVAAIILTGVLGNIICESFLKILRIKNSVAKGVAIGTSSHAIGTSKALEMGDVEGAISSVSLVVAGIITVLLAGIFIGMY